MNLKRYRTDHNLTQGELGERIRISQSAVNRMEHGETPSEETIEKVEAFLPGAYQLSPEECRALRQEHALSLRKAASYCGVNYQTILNYETGKAPVTDETILKIKQGLESVDETAMKTFVVQASFDGGEWENWSGKLEMTRIRAEEWMKEHWGKHTANYQRLKRSHRTVEFRLEEL